MSAVGIYSKAKGRTHASVCRRAYSYLSADSRRVRIFRSSSAMSENRIDEYVYNIRNELISATKNAENTEYQYQYSTNSLTPNSLTPSLISMSYDRMGRRVTKNNQRFVYDGYLCIKKIEDFTAIHYSLSPIHYFIWDPTEPVATHPLVWNCGASTSYYTHDGNKNVSEVIAENGNR